MHTQIATGPEGVKPRILYRRNRRMAKREGLSYRQHKDSHAAEAVWFAVRNDNTGHETLYPLGTKPGF